MYSAQYGKMVVELMDKFIEIFKMNAKHPSRIRQMLIHKHAFITELVFKAGCVLYVFAGGFYLLEPTYSFIFLNKLVPPCPVFFPYVDENTTVGYITLLCIHLVYICLAVIASACTDFMFIMIIINIPVLSNILSDEVREINESLKDEEIDMLQVKGRFRNILYMHRELWE